MTLQENLFGGPPATHLPDRPEPQAALEGGTDPAKVVTEWPDFSEGWAALSELALTENNPVAAYAYARTGYHRGLDQLRRAGWKGHGPVPWSHRPNHGFLRALAALALSAQAIGEVEEFERCRQFLTDSDASAPGQLGLG